jgi:PKD repeat protein
LGGLVNEDITPYVMTATGTETINYTMESLPAGLSWVAATHTIIGTPTTAGTYNVDMTASNVMGSDTKTLVITITEPTAPPVITSVLTDETTVNQSYTYTITATGEPDITYTATNLPAGLSFTSPNQITGVPTAAGTYNITLEATNGGGTTQEILELTVGTPPEITSWLTASGTAGVQFNAYTLTATGDATITYSMASLPQGLSFDANTQTVNGTPLYSGVYNVTMTAINDYGTDIETLVITINEGAQPPEITSSLTENAMKDFHYSYSITADGSQPMTFNVSTDDLPDGLPLMEVQLVESLQGQEHLTYL